MNAELITEPDLAMSGRSRTTAMQPRIFDSPDHPARLDSLALLKHFSRLAREALTSFEVMWPEFSDAVLASGHHKRPFETSGGFWVLIEVAREDAESFLEDAISGPLENGVVCDAVVAMSEAQAAALWALREDSAARSAAHKR